MKLLSLLGTIALISGVTIAANIAPVYARSFATNVQEYNPGQGNIQDDHRDEANALGMPQSDRTRDFLSLGMGGSAIFSFVSIGNIQGSFSGSITIWETTWGHQSSQDEHDERIEVFVGNDLDDVENWISIGEIWNIRDRAYDDNQQDGSPGSGATLHIGNDKHYRYIRVVDKSNKWADGFDINAIAVMPDEQHADTLQPIPEPATLLGLLVIGGLMTKISRDDNS